MKTIVTLFFIFILALGQSQTFKGFPTANARWIENQLDIYSSAILGQNEYVICGDTTIYGTTYHKICNEFNEYYFCFRNDSINQQIKVVESFTTVERLWFDFSLDIGDTVNYYLPFNLSNVAQTFYVINVDSILVGNTYYKRIKLSPDLSQTIGYALWIDHFGDVGNLGGFFGSDQNNATTVMEQTLNMQCIKYDTISYGVNWGNNVYETSTPCINQFSSITTTQFQKIELYPNPTTTQINFKGVNSSSTLIVYNSFGQAVLNKKINANSTQTNISNLPSGIYFVTLQNANNKVIFKQKMVKL